jgi:hypothetical protein
VPYEKERQYQTYNPNNPNHHLYSWNAQSLGNLLDVSGFSAGSIEIRKYGYDRAAAVMAHRLNIGARGYEAIRQTALLLMPHYELHAVTKPEPIWRTEEDQPSQLCADHG